MSLPEGAVFAPGVTAKIENALKALKADPHAPREVQVSVVLSVYNEYPKHVVIGKSKDGEPITKIVHSAEQEAAAVPKPPEEPEKVRKNSSAGGDLNQPWLGGLRCPARPRGFEEGLYTMPLTIDEEKFAKQETLDMSRPQGTPQGLPVKQIPHLEYPKCVYKHPVEPFREVLHRNANHEVVHRELVATEHLVAICQNEAQLKKSLKEGWVAEPYIPVAPPDPIEELYRRTQAKGGDQAKGGE